MFTIFAIFSRIGSTFAESYREILDRMKVLGEGIKLNI